LAAETKRMPLRVKVLKEWQSHAKFLNRLGF
jgi:hypothetical protein